MLGLIEHRTSHCGVALAVSQQALTYGSTLRRCTTMTSQASLILIFLLGVSAYGEERTCIITGHGVVRYMGKATERKCAEMFFLGGTNNPDPTGHAWGGDSLCLPGRQVLEVGLQTHGKCYHPIQTEEMCREALEYLYDNTGIKEKYVRQTDQVNDPIGCFKNNDYDGKYYFNVKQRAAPCSREKPCLCKIQTCSICKNEHIQRRWSQRKVRIMSKLPDLTQCRVGAMPNLNANEHAIQAMSLSKMPSKVEIAINTLSRRMNAIKPPLQLRRRTTTMVLVDCCSNNHDPPGCFRNDGYDGKYYFNANKASLENCGHNRKLCICKPGTQPKMCAICPKIRTGMASHAKLAHRQDRRLWVPRAARLSMIVY